MPRNKRTANYYAAEARRQDQRDAELFCEDLRAEGVFADVFGPTPDLFFGLVMAEAEYAEMLDAENKSLQERYTPRFDGDTLTPYSTISVPAYLEHPNMRAGNTAVEALQSAQAAYLGTIATAQ